MKTFKIKLFNSAILFTLLFACGGKTTSDREQQQLEEELSQTYLDGLSSLDKDICQNICALSYDEENDLPGGACESQITQCFKNCSITIQLAESNTCKQCIHSHYEAPYYFTENKCENGYEFAELVEVSDDGDISRNYNNEACCPLGFDNRVITRKEPEPRCKKDGDLGDENAEYFMPKEPIIGNTECYESEINLEYNCTSECDL